ncbi:MAG: trigger factor [Oligoflexia bacterium]|nr:trigger factor [Oligoflexia bacterium]
MSYTTEEVGKCSKKFIFNYTEIDLSKTIQTKLTEKQKEANFKGYRKGKVPLSVIKQFYGPQIEDESMREYISAEFYKTIEETKLDVIGTPVFSNVKYDIKDGTLGEASFEVTVDFSPEFELIDPTTLSFTKEIISVSDEEIEAIKEQMRGYRSELTIVENQDTALSNGLYAIANFKAFGTEGEEKDQEIVGLSSNDMVVEIGTGYFISSVEDEMIGMKKGDKKEITATIPEKYYKKDFIGKTVRFETEITEIKELKKPEFNEEFVKSMGYTSLEDFETKTKNGVLKYKENEAQKKLYEEIMQKLVENISVDFPENALVAQEEAMRKNIEARLKQQRMNEEQVKEYFEKWNDDIKKRAEFQIKIDFILNKFADKYEIDVTESDINNRYEALAYEGRTSIEEVKKFYNNSKNYKQKLNLIYGIREENTLNKISELVQLS